MPLQQQSIQSLQQRVNIGQQQQIRVNIGSNNQIGSAKALSPIPQASFSSTGPTMQINSSQPQPLQTQGGFQTTQSRPFAVFQPPMQYPGFAR